jgi:hypothetical protein
MRCAFYRPTPWHYIGNSQPSPSVNNLKAQISKFLLLILVTKHKTMLSSIKNLMTFPIEGCHKSITLPIFVTLPAYSAFPIAVMTAPPNICTINHLSAMGDDGKQS